MAGALIGIHVNDGQLAKYIASYKKDEKAILRAAYKKALIPLQKEAQKAVKKTVRSKTLWKGVRLSAWKSSKGASVYIRSPHDDYFKLLFFEAGTADFGKVSKIKKGVRRGRILPRFFFKEAVIKYSHEMPQLFEGEFIKQLEKKERIGRSKYVGQYWAQKYAQAKGRAWYG